MNCSKKGEERNLRNIIYLYLSIWRKICKPSLKREILRLHIHWFRFLRDAGFFVVVFFFPFYIMLSHFMTLLRLESLTADGSMNTGYFHK